MEKKIKKDKILIFFRNKMQTEPFFFFKQKTKQNNNNKQQKLEEGPSDGQRSLCHLVLISFLGIDIIESKRLSPTPSVSNLSLRPFRYLSTVTRSSNQGSVDGFRRERLQRFATFDSLSVQRRLEAR